MSLVDINTSTAIIIDAAIEAQWRRARAGHITGSRFHDLLRETKSGGYSTSRRNYIEDLITERLNEEPLPEGFVSKAMADGRAREPLAFDEYEFITERTVERLGKVFIKHPTIKWAGCSPDAFVGQDGMVSAKCPLSSTHRDFIDNGKIPPEYLTQMHWEMACTGRRWCDYISFDPLIKRYPRMRLKIKRIERDPSLIGKLEAEARAVLSEVEQAVERYRREFGNE